MIKISLSHRSYGRYTHIKDFMIDLPDHEIIEHKTNGEDEFTINEQKIIDNLPKDFLPTQPRFILLTVDDDNSGTGMRELKRFRPFAKYFHAYAISIYFPIQKEEIEE